MSVNDWFCNTVHQIPLPPVLSASSEPVGVILGVCQKLLGGVDGG